MIIINFIKPFKCKTNKHMGMVLRRGSGYNEMKFRCTLMARHSLLINITLALHPKLSIKIGAFACAL